MFGSESPFYKTNYDDNFFINFKNPSSDEENYYSCGVPMSKTVDNGVINYICEKCGECKVVKQMRKSHNSYSSSKGGIPTCTYVKCGNVTKRKTLYAIHDNNQYNTRVRRETTEMILRRSKETGIYIDRNIAYQTSIEYNKIRKTEIHRGKVMRGLIGACIIYVMNKNGMGCQRDQMLKLLNIDSRKLSKGESIVTKILYHFNTYSIVDDIDRNIKYIFKEIGIPSKYKSFLIKLIDFCHSRYIGIHSNDYTMCVGATWFMLCYGNFDNRKCRTNNLTDIKTFESKLSITSNTFNKFIDSIRIAIWQKPLPNTEKKPNRWQQMHVRQRQICVLLLKNGIKLVSLANSGRMRKSIAKLDLYSTDDIKKIDKTGKYHHLIL